MPDKIKIVMVDDEADLCFVVKTNLEEAGEFEVVTVSKPEAAESVILQEKPALVLLDNIMPGRKGSDIVKELRKKDAETRKIPIIMVSGKGEMVFDKRKREFKWLPNNPLAKTHGQLPEARSAEALAQVYGVEDYISKPFTTELLIDVIKDVLSRYRKAKLIDEQAEPMV
ncbi:MAG: response regulator [Candidatus Omnitrophota bacterium]